MKLDPVIGLIFSSVFFNSKYDLVCRKNIIWKMPQKIRLTTNVRASIAVNMLHQFLGNTVTTEIQNTLVADLFLYEYNKSRISKRNFSINPQQDSENSAFKCTAPIKAPPFSNSKKTRKKKQLQNVHDHPPYHPRLPEHPSPAASTHARHPTQLLRTRITLSTQRPAALSRPIAVVTLEARARRVSGAARSRLPSWITPRVDWPPPADRASSSPSSSSSSRAARFFHIYIYTSALAQSPRPLIVSTLSFFFFFCFLRPRDGRRLITCFSSARLMNLRAWVVPRTIGECFWMGYLGGSWVEGFFL